MINISILVNENSIYSLFIFWGVTRPGKENPLAPLSFPSTLPLKR